MTPYGVSKVERLAEIPPPHRASGAAEHETYCAVGPTVEACRGPRFTRLVTFRGLIDVGRTEHDL